MFFRVPNKKSFVAALNRTVTNVGPQNSIYRALVPNLDPLLRMQINVFPKVLRFNSQNEKQTFQVVVLGTLKLEGDIFRTKISWLDGKHNVTVPITIYSMAQ